MGDNHVVYSRRSLWFSSLSTLSNLLLVRSVFPKSLMLLESLLAAVTCQTHCQSPRALRQHLNQTFGWQWAESGGAVSWPAPSSELNPLNFWKWVHATTLVYSGTINALEVLQQRDENASREIQVKPGFFLNTTQFVRKEFVMTRMVTTQSICCKDNTNITHISGGFSFRKHVDCKSLAHLSAYLISL
jgi:hypothetical protein